MDLVKTVIDYCKDKNGNTVITPNVLRMLLANQRQDVKKRVIRKDEVAELLGYKNSRAMDKLLKDEHCELEQGLVKNTFTVSSFKKEQERHLSLK